MIPGKKRPSTRNLIRTLSKMGLCSRKQALVLVQAGRVRVNGRIETNPGYVTRERDRIELDGETAKSSAKKYFLFHKPKGCVTTRSDEKGRPTVYDWLSDIEGWIFPVGRLDLDSEGLLILTNDTAFGNQLTDPAFAVPRTYRVWTEGELNAEDKRKISAGFAIGRGEVTRPARLTIISAKENGSEAEITLTEGKNREVRRLFDALGKPVTRLLRISFGSFQLGKLKPGEWREIQVSGLAARDNKKTF